MAQKTKSDAPEIKTGNIIEFTNKSNAVVKITVARVDEKSWYHLNFISGAHSRNSYGTLLKYSKLPGFKIFCSK
jgi:hypothetical protein